MLILYIISTIIGGGLILVALITGGDHEHQLESGHDADLHLDHGHGAEHNTDEQGHLWLPFFSLRFWTYCFAALGISGLLLTYFTAAKEPLILELAIAMGVVTGVFVAFLMRLARVFESDSSTRTKDLLGLRGKVLVAVRPELPGKIRCSVKGETIEFLALSQDNSVTQPGEEVVIVAVENDKAMVVPMSTLTE